MKNLSTKEDWENLTPKELVSIIDQNYYEAKRRKLSRYDGGWGLWSTAMNIETRKRGKVAEGEERGNLVLVFNYWIIKSIILECYKRSGLINRMNIKRYSKDAMKIKDIIVNGKEPPLFNESFDTVVQKLLKVSE